MKAIAKSKPIAPTFQCCDGCPVCTVALRYDLTHREIQVIALVCLALENYQIGQIFGKSEEVIKHWIHDISQKVGTETKLQLGLWAVRKGVISPTYYLMRE